MKIVRPEERNFVPTPMDKIQLQIIRGLPFAPGTQVLDANPGELTAELVEYAPGTRHPAKSMNEELITVVISGDMELVSGGQKWQLPAGSIWYTEKNEEYQLSASADAPAIFLRVRPHPR